MKRDNSRPWKRAGRCLAAGLLALGLSVSLVPGAAAEDLPEWVGSPVRPTANLQEQKKLPEKFDLRHCDLDGDGVYMNYVTPVKDQSPWGSCWAFGGIAAAETSILSYLGKSWEETGLDLSEKHLAWFALQPVTEAEAGKDQAGEGLQLVDETKRRTNEVYDAGGRVNYVTTLMSTGVGPVLEKDFPYRGAEGLVSEGSFGAEDDWTIDEKDKAGAINRNVFAGFTLRDGNILPAPIYFNGVKTYSQEKGVRALKEELMAGHGVRISYCADRTYLNRSTWAQYAYEEVPANHGVCIVGWDDNYSRTNFLPGHQPPEDGAWIAKNSWGSEDPNGWITTENGTVVGKNNWGIVEKDRDGVEHHTGYFYLSYCDGSLGREPETMTFTDDLAGAPFYAMQYDYMPALGGFWETYVTDPMSSVNVFTAGQDMLLTSVSTRTTRSDNIVTMSVYLLDQDAKTPDEGKLAAKLENLKFPYAGYHRLDLTEPVPVLKGHRFSVVSCVVGSTDEQGNPTEYSVSVNRGQDLPTAKNMDMSAFCTARVNRGESWLYYRNRWYDWCDIQAEDWFHKENKGCVVDNFSIKAYGVPFLWDAGQDFDHDAVVANFNSGGKTATAVCAFYDKDGQMLGSSVTEPFKGKLERHAFPTGRIAKVKIASAKLFLLDEDGGKPMCEEETLPWIQTHAR